MSDMRMTLPILRSFRRSLSAVRSHCCAALTSANAAGRILFIDWQAEVLLVQGGDRRPRASPAVRLILY